MKPTPAQANWLKRIASSPLMVTHSIDQGTRYSLQNGATVPAPTATTLIRNGWVRRDGDGLFGDTQTYRALLS